MWPDYLLLYFALWLLFAVLVGHPNTEATAQGQHRPSGDAGSCLVAAKAVGFS